MSKKRKNKRSLENWFYKVSPFGKKLTRTMLYLLVIINFTISGFLFNETISTLEESKEVAQNFQERAEHTKSR
jgi:hypothetical protein